MAGDQLFDQHDVLPMPVARDATVSTVQLDAHTTVTVTP
jgi:hypothetical protein